MKNIGQCVLRLYNFGTIKQRPKQLTWNVSALRLLPKIHSLTYHFPGTSQMEAAKPNWAASPRSSPGKTTL